MIKEKHKLQWNYTSDFPILHWCFLVICSSYDIIGLSLLLSEDNSHYINIGLFKEKMGKCPFKKKNPAFCPISQIN